MKATINLVIHDRIIKMKNFRLNYFVNVYNSFIEIISILYHYNIYFSCLKVYSLNIYKNKNSLQKFWSFLDIISSQFIRKFQESTKVCFLDYNNSFVFKFFFQKILICPTILFTLKEEDIHASDRFYIFHPV